MGDSAAALWESELLRAREWIAATRMDKQQEHAQLFTRVKAHIAYKDHQRSLQSEAIASEDEDDTALDFLADVDASDMSALLQAEAAKAAPAVENMPSPVETTMPSAKDLMRPLDMPSNLASPKLKPKVKAVPMSQLDPKTLESSTTASVTAGATLGAEEDVRKLMVSLDVTLPTHSDTEETKTEESTPPHLIKSFGGDSKAGNHGLHVSASRKLEQLKYMQQASSKSPQDPHKKKAAIPATTKQDDDVTQEMLSWVTGCRDPEVIKRKENLRRKRKHPHRYGMASEEEQRQVLMKTRQIARDSDSESQDDFSSDYSPAEDDEIPEPDEPEVVDLLSDDYLGSDEDKRPPKRKRKRLRQTNTTAKTKKVRSRKPAVTRKLSQPDSSSESTPPPSTVEVNQVRGISVASEASHTPAMTKTTPAEKLVDGVTGKSNHPIELLSSDDESGNSDKVTISKAVGDRGAETNAGTSGVTQESTILRPKTPNSFKSLQDRADDGQHGEMPVPAESTTLTPSTARTVVYKPAVENVGNGGVQVNGVLDRSTSITNTAMQSLDTDADDADISDTGTIDLEEEDLSLEAEDNNDIVTISDSRDLSCREEQGEREHGAGEKPHVMTEEVVSSNTTVGESAIEYVEQAAIENEEKANQEQRNVQVDNGVKGSEKTTGAVLSDADVDDEDVSEAETEILDDDEPETDDLGLDYSDDSDAGGNPTRNGKSQTNDTTGVQKDGAVSSDEKTRGSNGNKKENTPDSSNAGVQQFFDFKPLKLKPKANVTTTAPKPLPVHTYSETHAKTRGNESEKVTDDRQKSLVMPAKPAGSNGLRPSKKPIATTITFKGKYAVTRRSTKMLNPGDTPGAKRQAKSQYTMVPTKKVNSSKDLDDVPLVFLAKELQKKLDDQPQTKYLLYAGAKKTEDAPTYVADASRVVPKSRFGGGNSNLNAISSAKQDYQAPLNGRQSLVNGKNAPQGGYRREPQISIYDALHMDGQESASDFRDGTGYKRPSRFKKMQEEAARNGTPMVKSRLQNTDWDKVPIPRKLPQVEKPTRGAVLPSSPKKHDYGSKKVGNIPNKRRKKNSGSSNKSSGPSYYGPQASKPQTKDRYDSPSRGSRGWEHNNYRREDDRWRKRSVSPRSRGRDRHDRRDDRKRIGPSRSRSRSVSPRDRDYSNSRRHQGSRSRSWSRERSSEHDSRRTDRSDSNYRDRDQQSNGSRFSDGRDSARKGSSEPPELGEVRQNGKTEHADSSAKKHKSSDCIEAPVSPGALATFDDDGGNTYISDSDDDEKSLIKEVEDIRFDLDDVAVDEALMAKQVYVTGLNPTLVTEQIEEDFARFGVAVDRETGFPAIDLFPSQRNHLCRGDACVTFETEDGAQEAAEELNAKNVKNSMIRVRRMDIHTQRILNVQFQTVRDTWRCTEARCRADYPKSSRSNKQKQLTSRRKDTRKQSSPTPANSLSSSSLSSPRPLLTLPLLSPAMSTAPEETVTAMEEVLVQPTPAPASASSGGSGGSGGDKPLPPRKERSKSRDAGKRMGGGQKASWKVTEIPQAVPSDEHDPNYDSEAEENVVLVSTVAGSPKSKSTPTLEPDELAAKELALNPPPEVKKRIIQILEEYFTSGDADEVLSSLNELDEPEFNYEVVKRAITMAMDKNDKERELASRLLSALYLDGLTAGQVLMGFRRVLLLAGDLQIDIPTAKNMLAIFCARAVVDEILPPSFLEDPFITRYAPEIAAEAIKKLSINHATARMEKAWGPGDGRPVEELKVAIDQLTKEYLLSRDLEEAARCVRELNVPHFHHEVVKRGITNSLEEGGDANSAALASLLAYLVSHEIVSTGQLIKGFERFKLVLDDVALDIPNAATLFQDIVARGISDGILPKDFDASAAKKQ